MPRFDISADEIKALQSVLAGGKYGDKIIVLVHMKRSCITIMAQ